MAEEGRRMCMRPVQLLALATMAVHLVVASSYQIENSPVITQAECSDGGRFTFPKPMLTADFYNHSCPEATTQISNYIKKLVKNDSSLPAAFIRLQFHDCFVRVSSDTPLHNIDIIDSCHPWKGRHVLRVFHNNLPNPLIFQVDVSKWELVVNSVWWRIPSSCRAVMHRFCSIQFLATSQS